MREATARRLPTIFEGANNSAAGSRASSRGGELDAQPLTRTPGGLPACKASGALAICEPESTAGSSFRRPTAAETALRGAADAPQVARGAICAQPGATGSLLRATAREWQPNEQRAPPKAQVESTTGPPGIAPVASMMQMPHPGASRPFVPRAAVARHSAVAVSGPPPGLLLECQDHAPSPEDAAEQVASELQLLSPVLAASLRLQAADVETPSTQNPRQYLETAPHSQSRGSTSATAWSKRQECERATPGGHVNAVRMPATDVQTLNTHCQQQNFERAIRGGHAEAVRRALGCGSSVNDVVFGWCSPLVAASLLGKHSVVQVLLLHGAHPNRCALLRSSALNNCWVVCVWSDPCDVTVP